MNCRVYWGSHGCHRPRGHRGGHRCDCCRFPRLHTLADRLGLHTVRLTFTGCVGAPTYYGRRTHFYGEDA